MRVVSPSDDPVVVAYLRVGDHVEQRTLSTTATKGDVLETEWRVASSVTVTPGTDVIGLDPPRQNIEVGAGSGATAESALQVDRVLQRFSYRVVGTSVEMLTPGRMFRARINGEKVTLKRVTTLPSLTVGVVPAPTT